VTGHLPDPGPVRVAAIDCGTNSIRLLVADHDPATDTMTDVRRRLEIVRLGQDVDRTGRLAPEAIERTRVALAGYAETCRDLGVDRVRMVATSATRDAANREDFRGMVLATLGAEPEVITGGEEAELSFTGAVHELAGDPAAAPPRLVVDIGGGSTELVLGEDSVTAAHSMDVGCVRLTERHLRDDPPTPRQVAAAEADVRAALRQARAEVPVEHARTFVGLAGSVTTVAAIALDLPGYDPARIHHSRIPVAGVRAVTDRLLRGTRAERAAHPAMHPGRVDVIGAGALILRVLMDETGAAEVLVSEHDILDGIAWSAVTKG
jgi:exopolyphosphatase / guanosine-5'-triphosphate,3'-diphosphate pyrophosphatase